MCRQTTYQEHSFRDQEVSGGEDLIKDNLLECRASSVFASLPSPRHRSHGPWLWRIMRAGGKVASRHKAKHLCYMSDAVAASSPTKGI
jgi:hypothetical protein